MIASSYDCARDPHNGVEITSYNRDILMCDVPHIRGDAMSHISHLKGSRHHGLRFKICARIGNLPFAYRLPSQRSLAELVSQLSRGRLDV